MSNDKPKTDKQRGSIHLWFKRVAKILNDNGITRRVVIEKMASQGLDTPWTGDAYKAVVYKPIFNAVTTKDSTEEANTTDHDACVQVLQKFMAEEIGVVLPPFPSRYTQGSEQEWNQ